MTEVQQSVIRMLTVCAEMAETLAEDPEAHFPDDLLAHIVAPGSTFHTTVTITLDELEVPRDDVLRLIGESGEILKKDLEQHYFEVQSYMAALFIRLARQAPAAGPKFSLQEFLQREALRLARDDPDDS